MRFSPLLVSFRSIPTIQNSELLSLHCAKSKSTFVPFCLLSFWHMERRKKEVELQKKERKKRSSLQSTRQLRWRAWIEFASDLPHALVDQTTGKENRLVQNIVQLTIHSEIPELAWATCVDGEGEMCVSWKSPRGTCTTIFFPLGPGEDFLHNTYSKHSTTQSPTTLKIASNQLSTKGLVILPSRLSRAPFFSGTSKEGKGQSSHWSQRPHRLLSLFVLV